MTTETTTGTTLEILSPYLAYGIEVKRMTTKTSGIMDGLRARPEYVAMKRIGGGRIDCPVANCLPILRPFSALCTPLPDGTVPAAEVARLALSLGAESGPFAVDYPYTYTFGKRTFTGSGVRVRYTWEGTMIQVFITPSYKVIIQQQEGSQQDQPDDYIGIIDYLRRNHFAVGLSEGQYIRKA